MEPCDRYLEQISVCLDGALEEAERRELMEHLAVCESCQAYFDDQLAVQEAFSALESAAPEGFAAQIMEKIRAEDSPERKTVRFPAWRRWAALAACCAVVCLGVWSSGVWREQEPGSPMMSRQAGEAAARETAPKETRIAEPAAGAADEAPADGEGEQLMPASLEPDPEPAAAPAAQSGETALDRAADDTEQVPAPKAHSGSAAQGWTLTASGPSVQAWVEGELGQAWAPGALYDLTEEQYASLLSCLEELGEDFLETLEAEGTGWRLLAGEKPGS